MKRIEDTDPAAAPGALRRLHVGNARVRLQRLLGQGATADVYLCELQDYTAVGPQRAGSRQPVQQMAMKLAHPPDEPLMSDADFVPAYSQLLWQEYDAAQKVWDCVTIANTFGFGMAAAMDRSKLYGIGRRMPCIFFEWAKLGDLWQLLEPTPGRAVPMTATQTKRVVITVMHALKALQEEGYMHRNVKPDNMLLFKLPGSMGAPDYKLGNLGCATQQETNNDGTQGYRPPQHRERLWQLSSDVYSLGKLLLSCRTAAAPLSGTYEELRASGQYNHQEEAEWDLVQVCLQDAGSRPRAHASTYFGSA